ncbi:MAG: hypothetical protein IPL79_17695 [Myxococcales bacterium]|nr:hypothetical protein [Myxococcales bacterium]
MAAQTFATAAASSEASATDISAEAGSEFNAAAELQFLELTDQVEDTPEPAATPAGLGAGGVEMLSISRRQNVAAEVDRLVKKYPQDAWQILAIARVRFGPAAIATHDYEMDPAQVASGSKATAVFQLTKRIAALKAVIALGDAGIEAAAGEAPQDWSTLGGMFPAQADPRTKTSKSGLGVMAAAITEKMDLEHHLGILTRGRGPYEGAYTEAPLEKPWTMRRRDGNGLDCTTFLLRVLNDALVAAGKPELFNAAMSAVYQAWRDKTGSSKSAVPEISGADVLKGMQTALGWQGFFVWGQASDSMPKTDEYEKDDAKRYKDAHDGSWHRVKLVPSLEVVNFGEPNGETGLAEDTPAIANLRNLPFALLAEISDGGIGGHMGILVYGKWYEVHWTDEASETNLIEVSDIMVKSWNYAAAVAPTADLAAAFKQPRLGQPLGPLTVKK